ncbi:MAG: hypothetical protein LBD58_12990 [Treponema sp.]|nr:hypothetical protein [Treponema sp.]
MLSHAFGAGHGLAFSSLTGIAAGFINSNNSSKPDHCQQSSVRAGTIAAACRPENRALDNAP